MSSALTFLKVDFEPLPDGEVDPALLPNEPPPTEPALPAAPPEADPELSPDSLPPPTADLVSLAPGEKLSL